jgi:DNA repair protein RecO (recombination protein O)
MSIEKTSAIVLSMFPWRETSSIVTLFTKDYGKVSGVAKGIRRLKPAIVPLERGQIIDTIIYTRQSRTLQTLTDLQVVDFFPLIRSDLEKTALRDIAIELILKSIHDTGSHPEFYERACLYFSELEKSKGCANNFTLLWKYILDVANLLGFGVNLEKCVTCRTSNFLQTTGGYFDISRGGIICTSCCGVSVNRDFFMSSSVLSNIKNTEVTNYVAIPSELIRLTRLLISHCRLHIEITNEFKSVSFIEEILLS